MNRAAYAAEDWRGLLLDAATASEVIVAIERIAQSLPIVRRARLLWELGCPDPRPTDADELAFADKAIAAAAPLSSAQGDRLAIPLRMSTAVLLIDTDRGADMTALGNELERPLQVADRQLDARGRLAELEREVVRLEHSEQVQRALFAISELAASDHDMPEVLSGIHDIIGRLMYAENFIIMLRDPARDTIQFLYFVDVHDDPPFTELSLDALEHTLTWYLMRRGKPLRGSEAQLIEQIDGPVNFRGTPMDDWMGVPMLREREALGAIVVQSYQPGIGFTQADQALLEFVANHVLTALERKRSTDLLECNVAMRTQELAEANRGLQLEVAERERAERLQAALFQIAQLATADIDEDEFYRCIHGIVGQLLDAQNIFIALLSDDGEFLEFPYYVDAHSDRTSARRPLARGLSEYVLRHRRPLLGGSAEIAELERQGEIERSNLVGPTALCWLGVPLFSGDRAIGLVALQSYEPGVDYVPADLELLGFVASQIGNSLHRRRSARIQRQAYAQLEERVADRTSELRREIRERERIQQQLEHEVLHDALTGLPNREQLHSQIELELARVQADPGRRCALLYLDFDRFKVINDSLGHLAGDDFLRETARRLKSCVRDPDLVARLAGDELAILLQDVASDDAGAAATASVVAQRVLDLLVEPMELAGRMLEPSVSIGIAIGNAQYRQADALFRDADTALYRAKALGRKRWHLFDESLRRSATDELLLETELRDALRDDRFEPYFQPIVRLADGGVVGHEALLRWNHPLRGVLRPADFLQIAEDSGVIDAIDWCMFKRSCVWAARTPDGGFLTINVSPRHLRREDFDSRLLELLELTGLAPRRLVIEVTEGSLMEDSDRVRAILDRLQASGVRTALDDFGTGYSSLSYLHTFPLRMLKIDRTFLATLGEQHNSSAVIAAVLALARALGMGVIAEGIETEPQRQALVEMGCEFGQGYLFGYPAPEPG